MGPPCRHPGIVCLGGGGEGRVAGLRELRSISEEVQCFSFVAQLRRSQMLSLRNSCIEIDPETSTTIPGDDNVIPLSNFGEKVTTSLGG